MRRDGDVEEWGEEEGPPSRTRARLKRKQHQQQVAIPLSTKSLSKQRKGEFEDLGGVNQVSPTSRLQTGREKLNHKDQSSDSDQSLVAKTKESPKSNDHTKCNDQPSASLSTQLIPEKQTLELILDVLQRRDTYEIFAEPVDPEEVEDYYEIITDPMDFGTMRAKLHEGMYKTLEQFEHDVFLISRNAMHFNSSGTIFFRQARAISELSKKVFHVLKTDPENFTSEFSGTRRRSSRRPQGELKDLNFKACPKLSKTPRSSSGTIDDSSKGTLSSSSGPSIFKRNIRGDRDGRISSSAEADKRCTYRPWDDNDLFLPNIATNLEPLVLGKGGSNQEHAQNTRTATTKAGERKGVSGGYKKSSLGKAKNGKPHKEGVKENHTVSTFQPIIHITSNQPNTLPLKTTNTTILNTDQRTENVIQLGIKPVATTEKEEPPPKPNNETNHKLQSNEENNSLPDGSSRRGNRIGEDTLVHQPSTNTDELGKFSRDQTMEPLGTDYADVGNGGDTAPCEIDHRMAD